MARVKLTRDLLEAYIVLAPDEAIAPVEAMALLARAGVIHGLDTDAVIKLEWLRGPLEHRVAVGEPPVHGEDAVVDYHFRTGEPDLAPVIMAGDRADYRNLGLIANVEAGELLATRQPPVVGRDGIDVRGQRLVARPPRNRALLAGKGCAFGPDRRSVLAAHAGNPRLEPDGTVTVAKKYRVPCSVGLATGNLDFDGDLEIMGDVEPQMTVRATGHVVIRGSATACRVSAGVGLTVQGHVLQGAILVAGGDMAIGFAEYASLSCGGALVARENLIHCEAAARGAVRVGGSIVGGRVQSAIAIQARVLGAPRGVPTRLIVDPAGRVRREVAAIARERAAIRTHLERLSASIRQLQGVSIARGPKADRLRELLGAFTALRAKDEALAAAESRLRAEPAAEPARVEATEVIHPEVEVLVGEAAMRVAEPYWAAHEASTVR